jgi:hypothetical protein
MKNFFLPEKLKQKQNLVKGTSQMFLSIAEIGIETNGTGIGILHSASQSGTGAFISSEEHFQHSKTSSRGSLYTWNYSLLSNYLNTIS